MISSFFAFDDAHLLGESATHPIEPPWGTLAALLALQAAPKPQACPLRPAPAVRGDCRSAGRSLAGSSLRRCRALPAHPMTAHSGPSNCRFQDHRKDFTKPASRLPRGRPFSLRKMRHVLIRGTITAARFLPFRTCDERVQRSPINDKEIHHELHPLQSRAH